MAIVRGDILLVNPRYQRNRCSSVMRHALAPALGLPLVAAATPAGWRVRFHDENLDGDAPLAAGGAGGQPVPEVVGITVHTAFAARAYALADRYRAAGAKVVLGGLHVTALPEEARPHADVVVVGDGVGPWPQVLEQLRAARGEPGTALRGAAGAAEKFAAGMVVEGSFARPSYADAPWPRRDILPRGAFLTQAAVIATRGCTQRCGFCYLATRGLRCPYQQRRVEDVVAEIDATGEPFVVFTDNNLMADPEYGHELCRALQPRGLLWTAALTIDVGRRPDLVAAMAAAGCQGVFIGLETLTDGNLRAQRKRTLPPSAYAEAIALLHAHHIEVNGSFVFGFDDDERDVFDRTVDFVIAQRLECATFHVLTPYPGTPLFAQLEAEGRLLTRDWRRYDTAHAVFQPAHMTPAELEAGYRRAYRRLYSWSSVWRRRPAAAGLGPAVLRGAAYLAMTALYKKWDFVWRALVPLHLVHAAWQPLVHLHRAIRPGAPVAARGTLAAEPGAAPAGVLARAA